MSNVDIELVLKKHKEWLETNKRSGERAYLGGADLREAYLRGADLREAYLGGADLREAYLGGADLREANLRGADLRGADLRGADLREAYLRGADLREADLREADLREAELGGADLREANLRGADLRGADLPNGVYQVVGSGSANRCTTYFSINDMVVCGCWNDGNGNTLESFKKRIESIYGEEGEKPNPLYYQEYRVAIAFFEAVRDLKGR